MSHVQVASFGQTPAADANYLNVKWKNTGKYVSAALQEVSQTQPGYMTAADKTKLDGIQAGATVGGGIALITGNSPISASVSGSSATIGIDSTGSAGASTNSGRGSVVLAMDSDTSSHDKAATPAGVASQIAAALAGYDPGTGDPVDTGVMNVTGSSPISVSTPSTGTKNVSIAQASAGTSNTDGGSGYVNYASWSSCRVGTSEQQAVTPRGLREVITYGSSAPGTLAVGAIYFKHEA